jgi:hypothetical protein
MIHLFSYWSYIGYMDERGAAKCGGPKSSGELKLLYRTQEFRISVGKGGDGEEKIFRHTMRNDVFFAAGQLPGQSSNHRVEPKHL